MKLSKNVQYYGKNESLPEQIDLKAGPLNLFYEAGDLRYIKYGDKEIIRRIYVAVRDRNWDTVKPVLSNVKMDIEGDSFIITYTVSNIQSDIDFCWQGKIIGKANGTITFSMDGEARSTFWRNRIGFCILHPMLKLHTLYSIYSPRIFQKQIVQTIYILSLKISIKRGGSEVK